MICTLLGRSLSLRVICACMNDWRISHSCLLFGIGLMFLLFCCCYWHTKKKIKQKTKIIVRYRPPRKLCVRTLCLCVSISVSNESLTQPASIKWHEFIIYFRNYIVDSGIMRMNAHFQISVNLSSHFDTFFLRTFEYQCKMRNKHTGMGRIIIILYGVCVWRSAARLLLV